MPVFSYLHQLFNIAQCQAYIHTLRWKDRPLQCPRCQSHHVGAWGTYHYQPGLKRYRCKEKDCKRTFNDLTGTLLDGSKRSLMHWILATFLLCLSCSSRRITKELGVHVRTGYRWSFGQKIQTHYFHRAYGLTIACSTSCILPTYIPYSP